MLDFYLVKDATLDLDHGLSEFDYLGGIDYNEFSLLQEQQIIDLDLNYFNDFRWTTEQAIAKLNLLEKVNANQYFLTDILRKAKERNCGVIAYSD